MALGIKPGEERSASLMLAHSFCMGTATVFFETAASALFLAQFGSSALPWVYIAAAVVNTATGLVYTAVQERVAFRRLMLGTVGLLGLATGGFRLGLMATGAGALLFGLMVFYRIVSALTDLEYWAVATRIYDVRQAKRLFGMIGSGEVVARIVGSFSVPLLVARTGVANLLWLSAAGLAACFVLVTLVLTPQANAEAPPHAKPRAGRGRISGQLRQLGSPYLLLLLGITVFAILSKYFVDYAFLAQMKARFADARQLASFFGVFSGVTQVLSLLTRVFVSGRVLSRFGIRAGLLVLPVTHALCTVALVIAGTLAGPTAAVFWLVMANQGVYKTLKHPIDNPSFKVLYQPLRPEQRLAAQIAVETIVTPITTGVAGFVMLLFTVVIPYTPARFSLVMLAAFAAWVATAQRAGAAYPAALTAALKGRIDDDVALSFDDEHSLAILREHLRSDRPEEVLFALDLLERTEHEGLGPALVTLLGHGAPDVRASAVGRLGRMRMEPAGDAIADLVRADPSPAVRAAAIRALWALRGAAAAPVVSEHLEDPDPQVRRAALVSLLRQEGGEHGVLANGVLRAWLWSESAEKRVWAVQIVAEVGGFERAIDDLLGDPVPAVRRAALLAAGRLRAPHLWPHVIGALGDPRLAGVAALALAAGGDGVMEAVRAAWSGGSGAAQRIGMARALGRIASPRASEFLVDAVDFPDERVRHAVLVALAHTGRRPADASRLESALAAEVEDAAWGLAVARDVGTSESLALLRSAMDLQLAGSRARVFLLLSLVYDPTAIARARDNLTHASKEKRAYALEILDVTLSRELKDLVLPLCDDLTLERRCELLEPHFAQGRASREARIEEVLTRPEAWVTPWTRACAAYTAGLLRASGTERAVRAAAGSSERLVAEAAVWALARIVAQGEEEDEGGRSAMLTIERVITLKAVPMFARASEEVLAEIAAILEEVQAKAGQVIFEKGEVGDSMYIIVEGRVRVYDEERTVTELGSRDIFGELALLDPEPRVASIAATTETRLFRLDREAFSELMAGNIEIVRGVLSVLCERLRKTTF